MLTKPPGAKQCRPPAARESVVIIKASRCRNLPLPCHPSPLEPSILRRGKEGGSPFRPPSQNPPSPTPHTHTPGISPSQGHHHRPHLSAWRASAPSRRRSGWASSLASARRRPSSAARGHACRRRRAHSRRRACRPCPRGRRPPPPAARTTPRPRRSRSRPKTSSTMTTSPTRRWTHRQPWARGRCSRLLLRKVSFSPSTSAPAGSSIHSTRVAPRRVGGGGGGGDEEGEEGRERTFG